MIGRSIIVTASLLVASPALAQPIDHSKMPGHQTPATVAAPKPAAVDPHAGHTMPEAKPVASPEPAPAPTAGDAAEGAPEEPAIPDTPPPPAPTDHAAERFYAPQAMAAARAQLRREHGGGRYTQVMAKLAEYQAKDGEDGFRWEGEAWYGGDINRVFLKSEGEGGVDEGVEEAEVQVLYSRAVGPYFDVQAGVRQDFKPKSRSYATVGFEGLAPYWFDVEGALFLSTKGNLSARIEGSYDLRLTQKLILQPSAELNLAAQDDRRAGVGSGLSNAELGLRLRYEIRKAFAPYIGVSWERKFGRSADFSRAEGHGVESTSLVVGFRGWF